jgi:Ser/Thr protein kinase RdoA (MazF antagonist)
MTETKGQENYVRTMQRALKEWGTTIGTIAEALRKVPPDPDLPPEFRAWFEDLQRKHFLLSARLDDIERAARAAGRTLPPPPPNPHASPHHLRAPFARAMALWPPD